MRYPHSELLPESFVQDVEVLYLITLLLFLLLVRNIHAWIILKTCPRETANSFTLLGSFD